MGAPRKNTENNVVKLVEKKPRDARPASTPDGRESQLVNLAVDLAEKQLRDGTASAAVMTHYLKLGTKKEHLERQILEKQSKFLDAKVSSLDKGSEADSLAQAAVNALKGYAPNS